MSIVERVYRTCSFSLFPIAKLESSRGELVRSRDELQRKITAPFAGARSELQLAIDRHSSQLDRSDRCLKEVSVACCYNNLL